MEKQTHPNCSERLEHGLPINYRTNRQKISKDAEFNHTINHQDLTSIYRTTPPSNSPFCTSAFGTYTKKKTHTQKLSKF